MPGVLSRRLLVIAWLVGWAVVLPPEWMRLSAEEGVVAGDPPLSLIVLLWDTTPWMVLLALAPLFWWWRGAFWSRRPVWIDRVVQSFSRPDGPESATTPRDTSSRPAWRGDLLLTGVVAAISIWASANVASRPVDRAARELFGDLPPAYHDEYSYLFQARTFLAGRASFPSHPDAPELFDQMHVLNEGKFASRYFPGTGAWMAAFVLAGHPYWGHWLAGAIAAAAVYFAGRELGGRGTGLVAGILMALSPGVALFGNLLLAHQPTLMGLCVFLAAFLRVMRRPRVWPAVIAGIGLSFAMLCRPMTAAGFAMPFGLWMAAWLMRLLWMRFRGGSSEGGSLANAVRVSGALAVPLLAGFVAIYLHDRAITGDGFTTPYALYTEIYTPRHIYGFDNVVRGEQRLGPKVLDNYDRWAVNLTPPLAARNVANRLIASLQWALGIVPLVIGALLVMGGAFRREPRWGFLAAAIVSLHAAHVPYWFDGIMHWHYVFESAPLWILLYAGATASVLQTSLLEGRAGLAVWWVMGAVVALLTGWCAPDLFQLFLAALGVTSIVLALATAGWLASPRGLTAATVVATLTLLLLSAFRPAPLWPLGRVDAGVIEAGFSRRRYAQFRRAIEEGVTLRPALVLIVADPADRHIDYVTNQPSLNGPVLLGRASSGMDLTRIQRLFPDRRLYWFDARSGALSQAPNHHGATPVPAKVQM